MRIFPLGSDEAAVLVQCTGELVCLVIFFRFTSCPRSMAIKFRNSARSAAGAT
jgi:hypothetical protein